jgi:ribosome-binding factor A
MHTVRLAKLQEAIHRAISEQLTTAAADPRLQAVTVSRVQVSRDGANAKVFILGRENQAGEEILAALRRARGYLRHAMADRLGLRMAPALHFVLDRELHEMMAVHQALNQSARE